MPTLDIEIKFLRLTISTQKFQSLIFIDRWLQRPTRDTKTVLFQSESDYFAFKNPLYLMDRTVPIPLTSSLDLRWGFRILKMLDYLIADYLFICNVNGQWMYHLLSDKLELMESKWHSFLKSWKRTDWFKIGICEFCKKNFSHF